MNHLSSCRLILLAFRNRIKAISVLFLVILQSCCISLVVRPGRAAKSANISFCLSGRSAICVFLRSARNTIDCLNPALPRLQAQHDVTRLPNSLDPPSARGTLWSTSNFTFGALCPQYWQVNLSRSKICQRSLYHPFKSILLAIVNIITDVVRYIQLPIVSNVTYDSLSYDRHMTYDKLIVDKFVI